MRITKIELQTRQPEKLKAFYTNTLGFALAVEEENTFTIKAGNSLLCVNLNSERADEIYHFAFRVPYHQFESISNWLQQRVDVLPDPTSGKPVVVHEEWEAKAVYFLDPDGNIVEFIAHQSIQEEEQSSQENGVVSICEIGLAVPHVPAFAAELKQKFGIECWKTANDKFEAVGDAQGLFILAAENRNWFPTDLPAAVLPVKVYVETPIAASINKYGYALTPTTERAVAAS
ncbi:VOC family protein [Pontibacter cellulosilyticus]|uniref:VOC family protein n=1 Tax=Pontibacter cellulosilyticus TaxID=1720253 RepID=A0A923SII7_9BACT|nr:VOC family protein [Pontibacter cellulosilyticus]MBC5992647.1 VOC family protein [Pontibacter cellulosilyticus]